MNEYSEYFARNLGVLTDVQQERLRSSRVFIIGCGGIGGTVASILARSGVMRFELVDFDDYEPSNMNRQVACFRSTLGRNKAEAVREHILDINPDAEVIAHPRLLSLDEIAERIPSADLVFPAADDFAFSIMIFRKCQELKRPALFVVPSGAWANVSIIPPDGPGVEALQGVPRLETYEELREMFETRRYKFGTFFYVPRGRWRKDYFRAFMDEDAPVAQLCPTVWLASSLGAHEALKLLSGSGRPVASPKYWSVTRDHVRLLRLHGPNLDTLLILQRRFFYRLFQTPLAPLIEKAQKIWWKYLF